MVLPFQRRPPTSSLHGQSNDSSSSMLTANWQRITNKIQRLALENPVVAGSLMRGVEAAVDCFVCHDEQLPPTG